MAEFGWAEFGSILEGVGSLAGAFAVCYAARLASDTFEGWRKQKISERRIDQAERILTAAYKARRALGYVRSPLMLDHELKVAEEHLEKQDFWASVTDAEKQRIILSQGYYNRMNTVLDERRAVEECLPMACALFGEEVEIALQTLNTQFHNVQISAEANRFEGNDRDFAESIREDLYSYNSNKKPNKMDGIVAEQVKVIEVACIPVLSIER
jgi:hypothetical protein